MTAAEDERPLGLERLPDNLLREPLDYIRADHFRHLKMCELLDTLVAHPRRRDAGEKADSLRAFLEVELPLHIADEVEDLFPSLRRRCAAEDRIDGLLDGLVRDHRADALLAQRLVENLGTIAAGTRVRAPQRFGRTALALTASERRHVSLENEKVLPLARQRLTARDLEDLGRSMAARRRIAYPD